MIPGTAYIDMEFAGIYGTHQGMQIPIEIGMVIHEPGSDTLSFAGKAFSRDINVELWKNITDDVGKRIEGQRRVFNLAFRRHTTPFDKAFRLGVEERKKARISIAGVHRDLKGFMQAINRDEIRTLVFFARRREMETFRHAGVNIGGFLIRDLQDEIRSEFTLKEHVSLDRMSLVTKFTLAGSKISSTHLSYTLPEKFRYLVKPHKAIGDAARMFLVDREMHQYPENFRALLDLHIEEYENRKLTIKATQENKRSLI